MKGLNADFLLASHLGKIDLMRSLVSQGCDVNYESSKGNNALHLAASEGNALVIPILIELGIDPSTYTGKEGLYNALHIAVVHKQSKVIPILAKFIDINSTVYPSFPFGRTKNALILAAQTGCIDTMTALLDLGIDTSTIDTNFYGALHIASACNHSEMIPILIRAGVDVNSYAGLPFCLNVNALHIAAHYGSFGAIRNLVEMGIDIKATDSNGSNAVHHAAETRRPEIIGCLLEVGCDQNLRNFDNKRPLDLALSSDAVVKVLVNSGCELNSQDSQNKNVRQSLQNITYERSIAASALRHIDFQTVCAQEVLGFLFRDVSKSLKSMK